MTLEGEQAVFWRRGEGTAADTKRDPIAAAMSAQAAAAPFERRIRVSPQAIEQLHALAPRWDKYMLEHTYIAWAKDKDVARNEDARFLGWVKSYTKGKPAP